MWKLCISPEMEDVRGRFTGEETTRSVETGLDSLEQIVGGRVWTGGVGEDSGVELIRRDVRRGAMCRLSAPRTDDEDVA